MNDTTIPPLPPGFELEDEQPTATAQPDIPPLPAGFELEPEDGPGLEIDIVGNWDESGQPVPATQPAPSRSTADELAHQFSYQAREFLGGVGDLAGLVVDPVAAGMEYLGLPHGYRGRELATMASDALGLDTAETPREQTFGRVQRALGGTVAGVGAGNALARSAQPVASGIGNFFAMQPGVQTVSAVGSGTAGGLAQENGATEGQQLAASLIGGIAPVAAVPTAKATVRGALRGGEAGRQQVAEQINNFASVGATPSVGQATNAWRNQGAESLLAGAPTSAGVMARRAEEQAEQIGRGLQAKADGLARGATPERVGRAVEDSIRGTDAKPGFVQFTRKKADELYGKLDKEIPADTRVQVSATREALADLNALIEGAPSVSRFFQNARLQGIEGALAQDTAGVGAVLTRPGMREQANAIREQLTQQAQEAATAVREYGQQIRTRLQSEAAGIAAENERLRSVGLGTQQRPVLSPEQIEAQVAAELKRFPKPMSAKEIDAEVSNHLEQFVDDRLPYEALQKLRTLVGDEIEGSSLISDVPRSKWKALYGALSRDMEAAATTPEAKRALKRANNYFNARVQRLEMLDRVVEKNGGGEQIYNAVMSGTKDGATTLRAVVRSLPPEARKLLTAGVIRRMGAATPGAQDAAGDTFSAATFLTNWNRVSPEAKRALFDVHGPAFAKDMDRIATVAETIKNGSKVFANPSGTANRAAGYTYGSGLVGSALTGQFGATAVLLGTGALANLGARVLTSPRFVKALARGTTMPAGAAPQLMRQLEAMEDED